MIKPLISIIVPCYNQAEYLNECLQSVMDQTYDNWECVIINDGSPDNTEEVTADWLKKDFRFKYIKQINGGLSSARNAGINNTTGEFILPLDADDKIGKEYLQKAIEVFEKNPALKVVYCKAEKFGKEIGEWILPSFSRENLAYHNVIFCSGFFKRADGEKIGFYDTKMIYGLEDWELWLALLKDEGEVEKIDSVCFYYRTKESSMIKMLKSSKQEEMFRYISIKHADFFIKTYGSFMKINNEIISIKKEYSSNIKSKKFVIDLFSKTFFGFTLFGKYQK